MAVLPKVKDELIHELDRVLKRANEAVEKIIGGLLNFLRWKNLLRRLYFLALIIKRVLMFFVSLGKKKRIMRSNFLREYLYRYLISFNPQSFRSLTMLSG